MSKDKIAFFFPMEGPRSPVVGYQSYTAPVKVTQACEEPNDAPGFDFSKLPLNMHRGTPLTTAPAEPVMLPSVPLHLAENNTSA